MTQVQIGLVGEELHSFTLTEILNGAVQEEGIFPELVDNPLPKKMAAAVVSGVERKFWEHTFALQGEGYNMSLYMPPYILPSRAFEDSKEEEYTRAEIANTKLHTGFLNPFRSYLDSLDKKDRKLFLQQTAMRTGVKHAGHILGFSDDRNAVLDNIYRETLFGNLKGHSNEQVCEIFNPDHGVPGSRVKEVAGAQYGAVNAVYLKQKATRELRAQGKQFSDARRMDTVLCFKPLLPGKMAFPEQGIVVNANGATMVDREVSARDIAAIRKGRILTYDHFNIVSYPGVPEGTTLHELKQQNPMHEYFRRALSPGVASVSFAAAVGVHKPQRKKDRVFGGLPRPVREPINENGPRTVVSSAAFMTLPPDRSGLKKSLDLPDVMRLSREQGAFSSLKELERKMSGGQAFVIQDPDNFPVPKNHGLTDKHGRKVSDENIKLLRELETGLIYSYAITLSTQSGAPNHFARPHLVKHSYYKRVGKWHGDMANMGLTGDEEREAYKLFATPAELESGLREWDRYHYQHNVSGPINNFVTEKWTKDQLGREDLGLVVSIYGSASSFVDDAYRDPNDFAFEVNKRLDVTTVDGGGSRSAMGGAKDGALKAYEEGYNVFNIGIRSESDVSPVEGDSVAYITKKGYEAQQGKDKRHIHFANGHMHVFKLDRLLQRQHPIAALSDISVFAPGGKGTIVEAYITMLHNLRVEIFGKGLFPGFESNKRKIPLLFSNGIIDNYLDDLTAEKRGVFDVFLEGVRDHFDVLDVHEFRDADRGVRVQKMLDFVDAHGSKLGYDMSVQKRPLRTDLEPQELRV